MKANKTSIVVVRHAERLDYSVRDSGGNWIQTGDTYQPWNTPLTENGCHQSIKLGQKLISLLQQHDLSPITAVYASPLLRCIQTASKLIDGLQQNSDTDINDATENGNKSSLNVRIEQGLIESINEDWYRSWSLPGSNSTWGYRMVPKHEKEPPISLEDVHPMAKAPVQNIITRLEETLAQKLELQNNQNLNNNNNINDTKKFQQEADPVLYVDPNHISFQKSIHSLSTAPYQWGHFETHAQQNCRMQSVVDQLAQRHAGETIIIVSHGGPVTHLYKSMMKGSPFVKEGVSHGLSKYTCCSLYTTTSEPTKDSSCQWENLLLNDTTHLEDERK